MKLVPGIILGVVMLPLGSWLSAAIGLPYWTGPLVGVGVVVCAAAAYGEILMRIGKRARGASRSG